MKKIEKYTGEKNYMFPNGALATREAMLEQFPAVLTFAHIIETDENSEVAFAVQNLSAMRTVYSIDPSLSEEDAIAAMQEILNAPEPEPEISNEIDPMERIALALEAQNETIDGMALDTLIISALEG